MHVLASLINTNAEPPTVNVSEIGQWRSARWGLWSAVIRSPTGSATWIPWILEHERFSILWGAVYFLTFRTSRTSKESSKIVSTWLVGHSYINTGGFEGQGLSCFAITFSEKLGNKCHSNVARISRRKWMRKLLYKIICFFLLAAESDLLPVYTTDWHREPERSVRGGASVPGEYSELK